VSRIPSTKNLLATIRYDDTPIGLTCIRPCTLVIHSYDSVAVLNDYDASLGRLSLCPMRCGSSDISDIYNERPQHVYEAPTVLLPQLGRWVTPTAAVATNFRETKNRAEVQCLLDRRGKYRLYWSIGATPIAQTYNQHDGGLGGAMVAVEAAMVSLGLMPTVLSPEAVAYLAAACVQP
jgi:hypothetical protein